MICGLRSWYPGICLFPPPLSVAGKAPSLRTMQWSLTGQRVKAAAGGVWFTGQSSTRLDDSPTCLPYVPDKQAGGPMSCEHRGIVPGTEPREEGAREAETKPPITLPSPCTSLGPPWRWKAQLRKQMFLSTLKTAHLLSAFSRKTVIHCPARLQAHYGSGG